MLDYYYIIHQQ